jgi:hypothetical protein
MSLFDCERCFTKFKNKKQYDEHIVCCEFIRGRAVEINNKVSFINDPIPNNRMLYESIKNCMFRIQHLEAENKELHKFVQRERKKIDILDYLKMRYPILLMDFTAMVEKLKDIQQKHLEVVFGGTIVDGVIALVSDLIDSSKDNFPICAFSHKSHTLYVYDRLLWTEMPLSDINNLFDLLSNRFLGAYSKWEQRRLEFMVETEDMKLQKMDFMKRILGTYISDEAKYQKFKSFLFNKLKQNVKSIIEYEFV